FAVHTQQSRGGNMGASVHFGSTEDVYSGAYGPALLIAAALAAGAAGSAAAQESDPLEEVTVTGSRIQRSGFESPTPVTVINRDAIDDLGLINVGDIMKQLPTNYPEVSATSTSQGSINGYVTDANIGAELANLRGLNVAFG